VNNRSLANEFHVSRSARDRCRFDESLFASSGHAVLARPAAAHRFAAALNAARGGAGGASAADLFTLGLLDEAAHVVIAHWRTERDPNGFRAALEKLERSLGQPAVDRLLLAFADQFPTLQVYRGRQRAESWLAGATDARSHREVALEELLLLALTNENPAAAGYRELFDDRELARDTVYRPALRELGSYLGTRPGVGAGALTLLEFLRAPMRTAPASLAAQLEFVRGAWGWLLGDLVERMQLGFDLRREEARWLAAREAALSGAHGAWGGGGSEGRAPDYSHGEFEEERFSHDADWMPRTVMIAKSSLVWLDQLSRKYAREVRRLDQVPDEELDRLASFGINALWLIGVWERSTASRRIKQLAGNPDAAASAYAVHDYAIAAELGGEDAWRALSERAGARGIRLASDMVPNHMGIDSRWVMEHPEWFLQRQDCPYPSYTFDGPELSTDERVSVKIEDHYWSRSDAAVVFRRVDKATGETRFIYHGNDGTSFPWNDTAQLDYLNPAAREAVIQAILAVARRFPIIRFDAAMTLAKRHIQRLWFPEPGSGGDIPSRAGLGVTREQFDRLLPQEFWRTVVDRVATEAPGTLLLAEAFWMMEGYFVRTLGMHRVYNSAFMVMLRDERNADYRKVLRDTLEFDPDILQRWVNFVNNPDERTAVDQFGRGEKYFGVCTLMATMPGLPMFGHGQVEGFEERYGMEFRRAMHDEIVDDGLEREHWRRIVPLLHRRADFAGSREFLLYDCLDPSGNVNEDVFAFTNRDAGGAALVLYHNRYADARGSIGVSVPYADKRPDGSRPLRQRTLLEGLGLEHASGDALLRCRDQVSGHEFLFRAGVLREHGFRIELGGYGSRVFLDWHVVVRDHRPWDELERQLRGNGSQDLERDLWRLATDTVRTEVTALLALPPEPALASYRDSADEALPRFLTECARLLTLPEPDVAAARQRLRERLESDTALAAAPAGGNVQPGAGKVRKGARTAASRTPAKATGTTKAPPRLEPPVAEAAAETAARVAWHLLAVTGAAFAPERATDEAVRIFDTLLLRTAIAEGVRAHGADSEYAWRLAARVRAWLAHPAATTDDDAWRRFMEDDDARWGATLPSGAERSDAPEWLSWPTRFVPASAHRPPE
jgi:glycosidase